MAAETGAGDPLEQLREQLDRTREAARALAREAAEVAAAPQGAAQRAGRRPPPAGWQAPDASDGAPGRDAAAVLALVEAVRDLAPAELLERIAGLLRELVLAVRALLDYVAARLESRPVSGPEVEDIPVT
jgi:hypothetical protein